MDQRCAGNTVATKTRKWTRKNLEYQLDVSRVNAQTIFCLNHGLEPRKYNSSDFTKALGMSMLLPHMATRRHKSGIQASVIQKMGLFLPVAVAVPVPDAGNQNLFPHPGSSDDTGARCRLCMDSIKAMPDAAPGEKKAAKGKLGRLKTQCQRCAEAVCKAHTVSICQNCSTSLVAPQAEGERRGEDELA